MKTISLSHTTKSPPQIVKIKSPPQIFEDATLLGWKLNPRLQPWCIIWTPVLNLPALSPPFKLRINQASCTFLDERRALYSTIREGSWFQLLAHRSATRVIAFVLLWHDIPTYAYSRQRFVHCFMAKSQLMTSTVANLQVPWNTRQNQDRKAVLSRRELISADQKYSPLTPPLC